MAPNGTEADRRQNAGCAKMSVCGTTTQAETIKFMVTDNKARDAFKLTYGVRDASTEDAALNLKDGYPLAAVSPHAWGMDVNVRTKGLALLQVLSVCMYLLDLPYRQTDRQTCLCVFVCVLSVCMYLLDLPYRQTDRQTCLFVFVCVFLCVCRLRG